MALTLSLAPLAPPAASTEHHLVAAARAGDDRAFEALYSRYRGRIASFIQAKVHDHGRAEDIAQDVFMSALRRLRASDQEITFKPWIYEIAKNACIDEFRRSKRAREVSLDFDDESSVLSGTGRGLPAMAPTPAVAVENKQRLNDLQGAFGGLSESHHKLLVMREFEGLSYTEIGARTGMSRQVVESTLFRARRKLSQEYDEIASGRRCDQILALISAEGGQALRSCGIRQRRQLTRHLAHCQPCRRQACLAGVDESFLERRSVAAKIAALLPFPLWRWPWGSKGAAAKSGSSKLAGGAALQSAGATVASSAAPAVTLGQAAVAATALMIAGAGGGAVAGVWSAKGPSHPPAKALSAPGGHGASSPTIGQRAAGAGGAPAAAGRRGAGGVGKPSVRLQARSTHRQTAGGPGSVARSPGATSPNGGQGAGGSGPAAVKPQGPGATPRGTSSVTGTVKSLTGTATSGLTKVLPKKGPVSLTIKKVRQTVQSALPAVGSTTAGTIRSTTHTVASTVTSTTHKVASTVTRTTSKVTSTADTTASKITATAKGTTEKVASGVGGTASKVTGQLGATVKGTASSSARSTTTKATSAVSGAASSATGAAQKAGSAAAKTVSGLLP